MAVCSKMQEEEDFSDYYDFVLTLMNASAENKSGITFKGSDDEYIKAHKIVMKMTQKKGDRFVVNGIDIYIADAPNNKPVCNAIKPKSGITGKVNLKIWAINKQGSGTMMITKVSRGNMGHVKCLAFKVIKYLLDNIIAGDIRSEDIDKMRKKSSDKSDSKGRFQ